MSSLEIKFKNSSGLSYFWVEGTLSDNEESMYNSVSGSNSLVEVK